MTAADIHTRLKEARLAAGFESPTKAVKAFGWTSSTYYGYENGDREPSKKMAERIAVAYKISLDWLLTGSGEMKKSVVVISRQKLDAGETLLSVDIGTSVLQDNDRILIEIGVLRSKLVGSLGYSGIDERQVGPIVDRVLSSLAKPASRSVVHEIRDNARNDPESPSRAIADQR